MKAKRNLQSGAAMALVMWLLAAMSVTVGGAVSLSRDEVSLADDGVTSARAFYLGKGVARLVMHDFAVARQSDNAPDELGDQPGPFFIRTYAIAGADVQARVIPSAGFVSLVGSDTETWRTLFTDLGGMEPSAAQQVASKVFDLKGVGAAPSSLTGFGAYKYKYGGGVGSVAHVESLLRIEGMTRDTYERVRGYIAPFSGPARPNLLYAPEGIKSAFGVVGDAPNDPGASSGFCIQLKMAFGSGDRYVQRVWVKVADGAGEALNLVKVERPVRQLQGEVG